MRRDVRVSLMAGVLGSLLPMGCFGVRASAPSGPAPPPAPPVVVALDQRWSAARRRAFHYTPQGTLLLPLVWLKNLRHGWLDAVTVIDPARLAALGFLADDAPGDAWKRNDFPVGWTVARFPSPNGTFAGQEKVGFTCAVRHTGELRHGKQVIRAEGAGAPHDAGAHEQVIGEALVQTAVLPWRQAAFIDAVSREAGESAAQVDAEF